MRLESMAYIQKKGLGLGLGLGCKVYSKVIPIVMKSWLVKNYPWDHCDPVWCSGKVLDRTLRGPGFNSPTGLDFFHFLNSVYVSVKC